MSGHENSLDVVDVAEEDKMNVNCIFPQHRHLCALHIDKKLGELFKIYFSYWYRDSLKKLYNVCKYSNVSFSIPFSLVVHVSTSHPMFHRRLDCGRHQLAISLIICSTHLNFNFLI